jgi:hypothetical protein
MWKSVLGVQGLAPGETMTATQLATGAICIVGLLVVALFAPNTQQLLSYPRVIVPGLRQPSRFIPSLRWAVAAGVVFGIAVSFIITQRPTEFLYFRF